MDDDWKFYTFMALSFCAIVVGIGLLGYWASSTDCRAKAQMMQMPHQYSFVAGCMVQTKSGWRPLGALREIDP
jgi:hypothetical protein